MRPFRGIPVHEGFQPSRLAGTLALHLVTGFQPCCRL